jgi:hypothetical protein
MVCTHGAKFYRLQVAGASQRALFVARDILRLVHAPARQRRRSRRGDRPVFGRGAGGRRALALPHAGVGRADDVRAAAIASEQSARVVAHFASSAVGPLRQLRVIGRLATAWLLLHFKRHLTTGAELVTPSDDEVRAYAVRVPTDTSDDSDESALYFDGAPWVGRTLDGDALACGVRFARGPVAFVAATQLPAGLRELESRFIDEQHLAKLCELAAVDRVATGGDSMSDMTGLAARMQAGMLMFSGRGGLQSQSGGRFDALFARLAYAAARSFGWTRCGAHLLARANRMAPLHDERGAQVVAVELFAGLARASRRWPTAERAPAREQLTAFLRQHCVLSGDGLDLGVEIAAALRFVANRVDAAPRRMARRRAAPRVARRLGARAGGRQRECAGARARPGVDAGARARLARRVVVRAHRGDLAARHRQPGAAALLAGARFDGSPRRRDAAGDAVRRRVATGRRARAVHCRARRRAVGGARAAARRRARRRDALAGVCRRAAAHRADGARSATTTQSAR